MASRCGSIAAGLKGRSKLSRGKALTFIFLNFYRLGMQATIILVLYEWPAMQIIGSLLLNFIWILIFVNIWPFEEKIDNYSEVINEYSVLATIYFLLCLTE